MIMRYLLRYSAVWRSGGVAVYRARGDVPAAPWMKEVTRGGGFVTVTAATEALERDALELARDPAAFIPTTCASPPAHLDWFQGADGPDIAAARAFVGEDLVRLWLARTAPRQRASLDPDRLARHVLGNPAYAVVYAHAAAAAVLRRAGSPPGEFRPGRLAEPGELLLLDALSWLPERVATTVRRRRPDVLARHLETLASRTIDIMSSRRFGPGQQPDGERLWLIQSARTGLAAGLRLLGVTTREHR